MAQYNILGVGAPFIDYIVHVSDEFLNSLPGQIKGIEPISHEGLIDLLSLTKKSPIIRPGGSCANTIKALSLLGHNCALVGKIGNDENGKFFEAHLKELNISSLYIHTKTPSPLALCLVTPDGERTIRSYLGCSQEMQAEDLKENDFNGVRHVHIEGHSLSNNMLTKRSMELAKKNGATISFDLGSFEIVTTHKEQIFYLLKNYVDVLFANIDESQALTNKTPLESCEELKKFCSVAVVSLGKEGGFIGSKNEIIKYDALTVEALDTTGAGDYFAAGFLHGFLNKQSLDECGRFGAILGSEIVQVEGTELSEADWKRILKKIKS